MPGPFLFLALAGLLAVAAALLLRALLRSRARLAQATELAGLSEARGRRLGLLVREIQGPGLALLGHAQRLSALPGGSEAAAAVTAEAQQLLRLADALSDQLAAEAGPRHLREEAVPLLPLLEETVAATAAQLGPASRQWHLSDRFADVVLRADRRALRGALMQVLIRAARLSRDGDCVEVRPEVTPDTIAIVVEDEGAGLPAEDLAVAATEASDRTRGVSFGLAVARSLLRAHGGELVLEAAPGIGARAWISLPRDRLVAA